MSRFSFSLAGLVLATTFAGAPLHAQPAPPSVDKRPALPFPPNIAPESICGDVIDFQDVETYDGTLGVTKPYVKSHEPTTVQLQWVGNSAIASSLPNHSPGNVAGERWCSGTLVAPNRVLTAGHCFDVQDGSDGWTSPFTFDDQGNKVYAASDRLAKLLVVNFGYQVNGTTGAIRTPKVYPITALLEHRKGDLDYAIVELGPDAAGNLPSVAAADVLTRAPVDQEVMALLQHPQGQPKKADAGHVLTTIGNDVYYNDVDSLGGSSGSGIRDADGKIIGVHTNGGCTPNGGANRGVTMKSIAAVSDLY